MDPFEASEIGVDMKAVEISQPGAPEVLKAVERPMPEAGPGEVLIKVSAAGVNRPDVFQRKGNYPPPAGASDLPGLEVAGEIVAGDAAAGGFKVGDKVCALLAGGGYAEYCVAPVEQCLPIPAGLSELEAAGLPETYFTVWSKDRKSTRLNSSHVKISYAVFRRLRYLRSFPTRRSSDLEIVAGDAAAGGFKVGDKVCALLAGGGYAEYCVAPVEQCLPIPAGLSELEAAGLPETYFTVWS